MIPLPRATDDPNIRALARFERENRTGVAGVTWKLSARPVEATLLVFKNGALLTPGPDYTVLSDTVTFAVALIVGDRTTATFYARAA